MPCPKIQLRFALALTAAVLAASSLIGCQTSASPPPTTGASYIGPVLTLDSSGKYHQVIASTASAGWAFTYDRTELNDGRHDLFVTLRRPNPLFSYSSTPVEQRAASSIRSTIPVDVYARICDADSPDPGPYSLAIPHTKPTP